MANISIKKDFKDGDKLLAQQLNNNFSVIEAGVNANEADLENVIQDAENRLKTELEDITADRGWDWNEGDRVTFFKGSEEEVANQEVKDGQLLYNETTGETYLDNGGKRIVTGSGNVVSIGSEQPTNTATKIWLDPEEIGEPLPHQLVVSPEEPATGEEVWFKNDEQKSVMVKNKEGHYEEFVKPQVKVSPTEPTTGEEVWLKKSDNLFNINGSIENTGADTTYSISGDTITVVGIWNVGQRLEVKPNTNYTISANITVGDILVFSNTNKSIDRIGSDKPSTTFNTGEYEGIILYLATGGAGASSKTATFTNVQLVEGTATKPYLKYGTKEIYLKNDNGVYELFDKVQTEKGFISAGLSEAPSFGVTPDTQNVLPNVIYEKRTNKFSLENGVFVINDGPHLVNVSVIATRWNTESLQLFIVHKRGSAINYKARSASYSKGTTYFDTNLFVEKGDIIYFWIYNNEGITQLVPEEAFTKFQITEL